MYGQALDAAVARSRTLRAEAPCKGRHDDPKCELVDPPVILSLNTGGEPGTVSHLGIRYPGTGDVASGMVRVKQEGGDLLEQKGTTCCYAKADKICARESDGIPCGLYTLRQHPEAGTSAAP